MAHWIVRYRDREVPLLEGRHVIGRSRDCALRLDDGMVSREHAELRVSGDRVWLLDLGSRNGVFVRYRRLGRGEGVLLAPGDTFVVGQTHLTLGQRSASERVETLDAMLDGPDEPLGPATTGVGFPHERFLIDAGRAHAQGDFDRFAGATHLTLETIAQALTQGQSIDDATIATAARHAVTLAEARGVEWVDLLLRVYEIGPTMLPVDVLTRLTALFAARHWRCARLDAYVARMRPVLEEQGPRGRAYSRELANLSRSR